MLPIVLLVAIALIVVFITTAIRDRSEVGNRDSI